MGILSSFLKNVSSITSVLPGPVAGLVALAQARTALQRGEVNSALALADKGISILDQKTSTAATGPAAIGPAALRAALVALRATSLKRMGHDAEAQAAFQESDGIFDNTLRTDASRIVPFLGDYLQMLVEFGASEKALEVTGQLSDAVQLGEVGGAGATPANWLNRLTVTAPTVRGIMDLGQLLTPSNPEHAFEAYVHAASIALAGNDPERASEAIGKALELRPEDGGAHRIRGVLRWRSGEISGAAEDFAAAVAANPEDLESRVALARAQLDQRHPELAAQQLEAVLKEQPNHSDALWLRGLADLRMGELAASAGNEAGAAGSWQMAVERFTAALEQKPDQAACLRSRAIARHHLGDLEGALQDLDRALVLDTNDVEGHGWRGVILAAMGRHDEALAAVNVALALIGRSPSVETKVWLLGIKGQALTASNWPDQAIETFREAVELAPGNEDMARGLLSACIAKRDWASLAKSAQDLQDTSDPSPAFRLDLRKMEIAALRNARRYEDGFAALAREPRPPEDEPEIQWLRARLLADIGDFETVYATFKEVDGDTTGDVDQLSLRGWVVQNLEASTRDRRTELGDESRRLYEAALELAVRQKREETEGIWLRKGRANGLLRAGAKDQALLEYARVIEECEETLRAYKPTSRLMALAGWCYHCRGENPIALRYYEEALNAGEPTIAIQFDYALVLFAAQSPTATERYRAAINRAQSENALRRIGLLRVALHDLRELCLREPALAPNEEIRQLVAAALRSAVSFAAAAPPGFLNHVGAFLAVAAPQAQLNSAPEAASH